MIRLNELAEQKLAQLNLALAPLCLDVLQGDRAKRFAMPDGSVRALPMIGEWSIENPRLSAYVISLALELVAAIRGTDLTQTSIEPPRPGGAT